MTRAPLLRAQLHRAFLILALLAPLALSACAKKGEPNPPDGAPSTYPRKYPAP